MPKENSGPAAAIQLCRIPKQAFYVQGVKDILPISKLFQLDKYGYREKIRTFIADGISDYVLRAFVFPPQSTVTSMFESVNVNVMEKEDQSCGELIFCGEKLLCLRDVIQSNPFIVSSGYYFDGEWFGHTHQVKNQKQRKFRTYDTFVGLNIDELQTLSASDFLHAILDSDEVTHAYLKY